VPRALTGGSANGVAMGLMYVIFGVQAFHLSRALALTLTLTPNPEPDPNPEPEPNREPNPNPNFGVQIYYGFWLMEGGHLLETSVVRDASGCVTTDLTGFFDKVMVPIMVSGPGPKPNPDRDSDPDPDST